MSAKCQKQTSLSARKDIHWPSMPKPLKSKEEQSHASACRLGCLLNPTKLFLKAEAVIIIALVDDLAVLDSHESFPVEAE
jgi:hypothetical protein